MTLKWLPNAICVGRILLIWPIVGAVLAGDNAVALLLFAIAGGSDGVDGFLAKTFHWQTRLGSLLDPVADKLLLTSVFVALTYVGLVPFAVTVVVVSRDIVIVLGAIAYQMLVATLEGRPTAISKLNTACQLSFVFLTLSQAAFGWLSPLALLTLGGMVVATSLTSGLNYVLIWGTRAWRNRHGPDERPSATT
jgi:cardiolipin synthase (CMP-forming)